MKVYVTRPINGIPINGMEFLLSDTDKRIEFVCKSKAIQYLQEHGCTPEIIVNELSFIYEVDDADEAEEIIHQAADSAKDWMLEKKVINFDDYDEWAGMIQAAQDYLTQFA